MPPSMRGKMRFANIFPCIDWAEKQLKNWSNLPESVQNSLTFLSENKALIDDLMIVRTIFKDTCQVLKNNGFGAVQKQAIEAHMAHTKR